MDDQRVYLIINLILGVAIVVAAALVDRRARRSRRLIDEHLAVHGEFKRIGNVCDAGGGHVQIWVDRDLDNYPELGTPCFVIPKENPS